MPSSGPSRRSFLAQGAALLALARSGLSHATRALSPSTPQALGRVLPVGDLGHRMQQNFTRLHADIYQPPALFRQVNWQSWPGDFEGRILLADVLLARATGQTPDYFPAMLAAYPSHLNAQGYFGPLLDLHAINEQQLSGHGWYLRALCEYYEWKRDPATLAAIRTIVRNLALPLRGSYAAYPIDPTLRAHAAAPSSPGAVDGHLDAQHGNWAVSSDTGCAFIFLDGLAHAWAVLYTADLFAAGQPDAAPLKALIDEAIDRFLQVDLVAIKAQTHATLTALRALLRVYAQTGDPRLLAAVRDRYALYRTTGMTEHYANTNWFGRPDSWTEPCAIIDSFMVATQLWLYTTDPAYLHDAHRIWYNGVGRGLRANGGFGTDTCVGRSPFLRVRSYEAYFCCTMRGGEGHARAAQYLYFTRPGEITIPFFSDSEVTLQMPDGTFFRLRQTTGYPYAGGVRIQVLSSNAGAPIRLRLFAPEWTSAQRLTLNGKPLQATAGGGFLTAKFTPRSGQVLALEQSLRIAPRDAFSSTAPAGSYVFEAGPLVLGHRPEAAAATSLRAPDPAPIQIPRSARLEPAAKPGEYRVAGADILLARINDLNEIPAPPTDPCPRQILFREG